MLQVIDSTKNHFDKDVTRLIREPGCADVGVQLPSGLTHWFSSEDDARRSQYWPFDHHPGAVGEA